MTSAVRALIIFDETREPLVFPGPSNAAAWMEAVDVDDGVYGEVACGPVESTRVVCDVLR